MGLKQDIEHNPNHRRVVVYPNIYYFKLVVAYSDLQHNKRTHAMDKIVRDFFAKMAEPEKKKLLDHYETMSEDKILRPRK